jgi:PHD/YefM family antitoxin component YafN of YafNO toxin-antitoxin module
MIRLNNIHALDHFKRNTAEFRERLKQTGQPEVLTVDGRPELVVQSAEGFQRLMDRLEELDKLEHLRESIAQADAGNTTPADQVFDKLRREAGLEPRKSRTRRRSA